MRIKFWYFIHNAIAHPLLILGFKWTDDFHDWSAEKLTIEHHLFKIKEIQQLLTTNNRKMENKIDKLAIKPEQVNADNYLEVKLFEMMQKEDEYYKEWRDSTHVRMPDGKLYKVTVDDWAGGIDDETCKSIWEKGWREHCKNIASGCSHQNKSPENHILGAEFCYDCKCWIYKY